MEDSLTILALAGGGKVERVDWSLVLANFADEPATTAHKAGPHVLGAKLQGGLQGCHELSPVQLLHVLDAVGVGGRVEILPRPHSFCQWTTSFLYCLKAETVSGNGRGSSVWCDERKAPI